MLKRIPWFVRKAMADKLRSCIEDIPVSMDSTEDKLLGTIFCKSGCVVLPRGMDIDDPGDAWSLVSYDFNKERHTIIQPSSETDYVIYRTETFDLKEDNSDVYTNKDKSHKRSNARST